MRQALFKNRATPGSMLPVCLVALVLAASQSATASGPAQDEERYAQQGQAALAAGDLKKAQEAFEKLNELAPHVAEVHATLGRIYYQQRNFAAAAEQLRTSIKLKPGLAKVHVLLAVCLAETLDYRGALPGLEECFRGSTDPSEKRMCGLELERADTGLKMDQKTVEVALAMEKLYPDDAEVLYRSSQIYGTMAYRSMERLSYAAPSSPWRFLAAGEVNESQGNAAAAIEQYRQVLALDPNHPGIHYRIGRALLAQARKSGAAQDRADALSEFLAELAIDPANANASYEVGEINRNAMHLDQARKYFQAAIDTYPGFADAHLGLATVLLAEQQPLPAVHELQKAIAIDPANEVSWYRLSQAQRSLGHTTEQTKALAEFRKLHQQQAVRGGPGALQSPSEVTQQIIDPGTNP